MTALLRYGKSRAFTTNPAWSLTSTGVLPHSSAKVRAVAIVVSLAVSGRTSSTSAIEGAGLKKWIPHTRSGRPVSMAMSMTARVDVLVASTVDSPQIRSSSLKRCFLVVSSSTTDSRTRSQSARRSSSEVGVTRASAASLSASDMRPFDTALESDLSRLATALSAVACWRERSTTS